MRRMGDEFRQLPKGTRAVIYAGGSALAVLLLFTIFVWPMFQRPVPEPEGPPRETVAEFIDRIDNRTQGQVPPELVPDLIAEIEEERHRVANDEELARLYILKFKVFFNARQFVDAALIGAEVADMDILVGEQRFEIYSGLVFAYEQLGDAAQRRHFAELALAEFDNGTIEDFGSRQYYAAIVAGIF